MPRRPLIGITCYVEQARWGVWDMPAALVPYSYVRAVEAAGGRAVVVPPVDRRPAGGAAASWTGWCWPAAPTSTPQRYGEEAHEHDRRPAPGPGRRRAHPAGRRAGRRPARAGDLPGDADHDRARGRPAQPAPARRGRARRATGPPPASTASTACGIEPARPSAGSSAPSARVRSYHHQGVADAGTLTVTGWAEDDGTVEVVEDPGPPVRARRAVAPRGRRRPAAVRRAGRCRRGPPRRASRRTSGGRRRQDRENHPCAGERLRRPSFS